MRSLYLATASAFLCAASLSGETLIEDKFTAEELPRRAPAENRGEWKFADGVASCTQDDALYAKNKSHGPVIWYNVPFKDGTVKFSYKPQQVKTFVFTLNNEKGHVFRFIVLPTGLSVRAWPVQGHEGKAQSLLAPKPGSPALKDGEWAQAELKFEGKKCSLKLGDFQQTFENDAIALNKTTIGLGFSFGTLALRDVSVTTP